MYVVVEVVKDGMLSVTFAMVVLGLLFLFPGFFIQVKEMPAWISWISYIVPTKVSWTLFAVHAIILIQAIILMIYYLLALFIFC
jgi:small-conductance mechanosensitive channel